MFTQNISQNLVNNLVASPPNVFGKSGIVVKIGSNVWLRTGMNKAKWQLYQDVNGNVIGYDDPSGGQSMEWFEPFQNIYTSTDDLLTQSTDQKTIDTIENARNSNLGSGKSLTPFDLAWLWFKVKLLGMADNTYSLFGLIPWWIWLILGIFVFLYLFKHFKKRR